MAGVETGKQTAAADKPQADAGNLSCVSHPKQAKAVAEFSKTEMKYVKHHNQY